MDKNEEQFPTEADVDDVLAEFDGDPRSAIRALLHDLAVLALKYEAWISTGFVRSGVQKIVRTRNV